MKLVKTLIRLAGVSYVDIATSRCVLDIQQHYNPAVQNQQFLPNRIVLIAPDMVTVTYCPASSTAGNSKAPAIKAILGAEPRPSEIYVDDNVCDLAFGSFLAWPTSFTTEAEGNAAALENRLWAEVYVIEVNRITVLPGVYMPVQVFNDYAHPMIVRDDGFNNPPAVPVPDHAERDGNEIIYPYQFTS